jgi:UPF0755 protein
LLLLETGLVLAGLMLGACLESSFGAGAASEYHAGRTAGCAEGSTPTRTFSLEADGVIKDAFWLRLYWRFNLAGTPLHSGEYRMPPA